MSIYKECDIRGIFETELDEAQAYEIGRAVGSMLFEKRVLVCGDARFSTPGLKAQLTAGLQASGAHVVDMGLSPTPAFYFGKAHLQLEGGVMVTASHNPWQYNGFKIALGDQPIRPEDIQEIARRVKTQDYTTGSGTLTTVDLDAEYQACLKKHIAKGNRRVVVDAGGGATSLLAPNLFQAMGYDVVPLFCQFDGKFSNRNPNPAVYSHLTALQTAVVEAKADFGVAFDGDGDRVVFVDELGNTITSERTLCLFLEHLPEKKEVDSVVYDLKSSSIIEKTAQKLGVQPVMERSGHAFIKRTFLARHSSLAGEISGHFFFQELGHDDGIFAALRMGEILSQENQPLSQLIAHIPMTIITPDIRIHWPYDQRDGLLEQVKAMDYPISLLDGVRVQLPNSWILMRKSVTEEGVTLRIEADSQAHMDETVNILLNCVPALHDKLP